MQTPSKQIYFGLGGELLLTEISLSVHSREMYSIELDTRRLPVSSIAVQVPLLVPLTGQLHMSQLQIAVPVVQWLQGELALRLGAFARSFSGAR